ncbi:MAG: glycosyltransferase family 2 protein [Actinobacteria bacterium]|nr:glycosyltransferase family 2 protein [Actinomycetota bacterium]
MKQVSAIIINYNGLNDLPEFLESLRDQDYENIELVVIDNCSSDGSREFLKEFTGSDEAKKRFAGQSPTFIENRDNRGFSAALNTGISQSNGEFILSLNTDVVLEPEFLSTLMQSMNGEKVGSASGKLLRFPPHNRDNIIDSAGHLIFRNRLAENRGEGETGSSAYMEDAEVFGTCGAAALYSREMLEDIKVSGEYFDEDFFAFWEDLDVDWRSRLRGWHCVYNPRAIAYHKRGGAGYRKSVLVEYHNYKNRCLMVIKNDRLACVLRNLPGIIFTDLLKGGALLIRCPRALLASLEVLRLLPRMLKKRKTIQSGKTVSDSDIDKWFQPFYYGKWIRRHLLNRGEMIIEGEKTRR